MNSLLFRAAAILAVSSLCAYAHVGNPDMYLDANAGPYRLFVTVRPPTVIPGVAELEVRSESSGVTEIRAVPLPMEGSGARFAPVPDRLKVSKDDPHFFTGSLWMMTTGSWQIRLNVSGSQGAGVISVPIPSVALATKKMQAGLGIILVLLGLFLVGGLVAIVGASVREAKLNPGAIAPTKARRRAQIAMSITFAALIAVLWFGDRWWASEEHSYSQNVYKPLQMSASLQGPDTLHLNLTEPGWRQPSGPRQYLSSFFVRRMDDLVSDHDHVMHLYAIRQPGLDVVYHLHPTMTREGLFEMVLPSMPGGTYKLYADIVHANGFPETLTANLVLPHGVTGSRITGDDAEGAARPWNESSADTDAFSLPDGYKMQWLKPAGPLRAKHAVAFRFRLMNPDGSPADRMQLYMGMLGHAAFVKTDGTVFAHVHPTGSVSMAAFMLAQQQSSKPQTETASTDTSGMDIAGMNMPGMNTPESHRDQLPSEVSFPYGLPTPGRYRIFVQMKHDGIIETGTFDAQVD